ncbi:hypothetical protein VHEMI04031 [[Torrubiella] hemipterigena]|uniref:FAD-binding PCMH-type domain-containing protein n=1 Tax=[Torrubiella] hemipterigena TaxID=1531966 RepID=A0A0A1SU61_9HYPO|nr:hypothetical protein VHEMI04031 [[Torrubiella] hemipterigena]
MAMLYSILSADEIITAKSNVAEYNRLTSFWDAQNNLSPPIVCAPKTIQSLSVALKYLYSTELDIGIRGNGYRSPPVKDVLVSLTHFDDFVFNADEETVTAGAGQQWTSVFEKIDEVAPEYTVVGTRTPSISVGGSIVSGGFSWLSGEYGCISDPQNLLDCQVVKFDGSVVWASEEPDLLWALRGGGPGYGVIVKVILRARKISRSIFCGTIIIPKSSLSTAVKGLVAFMAAPVDPGVSAFMFLERPKFNAMHLDGDIEGDIVIFQIFDRHGQAHGKQTFSWLLELPGVMDMTIETNMLGVIKLQDRVENLKGTAQQYSSPMIIDALSERQVSKCLDWFQDLGDSDTTVAENTFMIFEMFCTTESPHKGSMAWPGPRGCKHMLVVGVGCELHASAGEVGLAECLAASAPHQLMGDAHITYTAPNAIEKWHSTKEIYGEHFERLVSLRNKYDPERRFKGTIGYEM